MSGLMDMEHLKLKVQICCQIIATSSVASLNKADAGIITNKIFAELIKPPEEVKQGNG
jgi:hypothetical protein